MKSSDVSLLLVGENPHEIGQVQDWLVQSRDFPIGITCAGSISAARSRIAEAAFDAVIIMLDGAAAENLAALLRMPELPRSVPVLAISRRSDRTFAIRTLCGIEAPDSPNDAEPIGALTRMLQSPRQQDHCARTLVHEGIADSLFENTLDAILLANDQQEYIEANPAACRLLEYSREELLDRRIWDIVPPTDNAAIDKLWHAFVQAGTQEGEMPLRTKSGRTIIAEYRAVANIQPGVHLSVLRDVTQARREAEARQTETARTQALLQAVPDVVLRYRSDGTIIDFHGPEEDLVLPAKDMVGANMFRYLPERIARRLRAATRRAIQQGTLQTLEFELDVAAGRRAYEGRVMRSGEDEVVSLTRNITERRGAARTRDLLATIVEQSDDAIFSKSPEGTILSWNAGAEAIYGYSAAEAIGQHVKMLVPPDRQGELEGVVKQLRRGEPVKHLETVQLRKDGTSIDVSLTIFPLRDEHGNIIADSTIARDITSQKRAARATAEGEEMRRAILNSLSSHVAVVDRQGKIVTVNDAWEQFASENSPQPAAVGPGANYLDVCRNVQKEHSKTAHRAFTGIRAVLDGLRDRFEMEYPCHSPDEQRWFLLQCSPLKHADGGAVITHTNITVRKQAELALAASENRYRSLVTATASVVWTANAEGDADHSLPLWKEYSGQSLPEHRGEGWSRAVHSDDRQQALKAWTEAVQTQTLYEAEYRAWHAPSGQYRHVVARAAPVRDTQGTVKEWVGAVIDVDDHKRAQAELQQHREQLAHLNRRSAISEMAAILAHELSQPLAVIMNYAGPLAAAVRESATDAQEVASILDAIGDQAHRAGEITKGLRRYAARQTNREKSVHAASLFEDIRRLTHGQLQADRTRLRFEVAADAPCVSGDRVQLQQVLINLIQNAVDAMEHTPSEQREIVLRAENDDGGLLISVSDRGTGLPRDNIEQIFESYYTTKPEGVGLGLTICRSIVVSHGGRIWAASNPDRGLTFHIRLPAQSP